MSTVDIDALKKGLLTLASSLDLMQNAQPGKGSIYRNYSVCLNTAVTNIELIVENKVGIDVPSSFKPAP